jgi:fido (protein-threonine AMPylation protein)
VYEWAGDPREINISKGAIRFAMMSQLESSAAEVFGRLARENRFRNLRIRTVSCRVSREC